MDNVRVLRSISICVNVNITVRASVRVSVRVAEGGGNDRGCIVFLLLFEFLIPLVSPSLSYLECTIAHTSA